MYTSKQQEDITKKYVNALMEYIRNSYLRIAKYLNTHTIKLYGGNDFLYVVMQAENHNGQVVANWFSRLQKTATPIQDSKTSANVETI